MPATQIPAITKRLTFLHDPSVTLGPITPTHSA